MDGILLINKPEGWTSHDVVAKVRNVLKAQTGQKIKVGHTGTLDPAATGLLILVLGSYTKQAAEFSKLDKTYEAEITLGSVSSTGDKEGEITQKSTREPSGAEVREVLNKFIGESQQMPPAHSAIKVDGKRAYKLAREGKTVQLKPRPVTIYSIEDINCNYPKLSFTTSVSSGTYIRSLASDIGEIIGTGAYLSGLRRTTIGQFKITDSRRVDDNQLVEMIIK